MSKKKDTNNLGAINALKGYRVQFLYTLLRILSQKEQESVYKPEGEYEDLDIYNADRNVIEIIQVKDFTNTLTLSKILSLKENTFIRRALNAYKDGNTPIIKLVSFSEVNDDIKNLRQKSYTEKTKNQLKKLSLNNDEIKILEDNFDFEVVNESEVYNEIISKIESWNSFTDYKITLNLLVYWVYIAAEKRKSISLPDFKEQFEKICKFQSERISFYRTYNTIIKPLDNEIETENTELLKSDFYQGISATYNHILANTDVPRSEKLKDIKENFEESNIVFIHGASGQGKSTLAYRYLHDYCNEKTVFELKHLKDDLITIYEVINSLEGISKGILFPITLYIDVDPGNKEWINILKELASKNNFNFLVTIREEDWNTIEVGDKFQFSEIELLLEKKEAELIYNSLSHHNLDLKFLDFENAWETFGGNGPLLEFVYLVTQSESLSAKLKSQINKIRSDQSATGKEKIEFLRFIILSDCFGSKVKYKEFANTIRFNDIGLLVDLLQKEYLIKVTGSKTHITGLHPVRSKIIKNLLFDNEIHIESDYVLEALPFISDNSILNFLRNAFRQSNLSPNKLLEKIATYTPKSWQTYFQIFKSLLWKGLDDYVNKNIDILNRIYKDYNKGWITVVNFDFADLISGGSLMENSDIFEAEQRQYAKTKNKEFSDRNEVFEYCQNWLNSIKQINIAPNNTAEWEAFGLFLFWLHHLKQTNVIVNYESFDFDESYNIQPLAIQSYVLYALKSFNKESVLFVKKTELAFLRKLSRDFNIISIEQNGYSIDCRYLLDIIDEKTEAEGGNFIHAKSIKIIELLRFAFPDKNIYGTKGIGHKISFLPDDHDSSIKQIPKKSLPLKPLVEINSSYIGLFDYTKRPSSWQEYVEIITSKRQVYIEILKKLVLAFENSHKLKNLQPLAIYVQDYADNYLSLLRKNTTPSLPKIIIDEWGDFNEGSAIQKKSNFGQSEIESESKEGIQVLSIRKYNEFVKLFRDFESSIENFLWQSPESIIYKIKVILKEDVSDINNNLRLSLVNLYNAFERLWGFQKSFNTHFKKFVDERLLQKLEKDEKENISALCFLFHQFIYSDFYLTGNVHKLAIGRMDETEISFKKKVNIALKQIGKELSCNMELRFEESSRRCILIADIPKSLKSFEVLEAIYNKLYDVIAQPDFTSLKYLIINTKYPAFNIILLISGKTINDKWYEFKTYNLREKRFNELAQFNLIPQDIPSDVIENYNLKSWNKSLPEFSDLDKLLESISTSYILAYHFSQLKYFENKTVEDYNEEILTNHIKKTGRLFQENLQKAMDLYGYYSELCNQEKLDFDDNYEKLDFYNILLDNHRNFYPNDELYEKGEFNLSLGAIEMENWLPRLEILNNNISIIYFFIAGKIIEGKLKSVINV